MFHITGKQMQDLLGWLNLLLSTLTNIPEGDHLYLRNAVISHHRHSTAAEEAGVGCEKYGQELNYSKDAWDYSQKEWLLFDG